MSRMVLAAFLFGLLGVGCMPHGFFLTSECVPESKATPRPAAPPVQPEQVTPANAHEVVRRLDEEMNNPPTQGIQANQPLGIPNAKDRK